MTAQRAGETPLPTRAGLESFLNPRSIALFGASEDQSNLRGRITRLIPEKGFDGELHLINPSRTTIMGRPAYPSLADVGTGVDLAALVVPASQVLASLEDCARMGVRNALVLSSGFADGGGEKERRAQDQIAELARSSGMRICGPNTVGFFNEVARIAATFSPAIEIPDEEAFTATTARVGIIAQSGGLGFSLYHRGRLMGLSFSTVVTTGNEVDLTAADFLAHLAADKDTRAILMFLETIRDGEAFIRGLRAAADAGKPVVIVKVGRSAAAGRATVSHTGSIAGWDAAYDAVFASHGAIVAEDLGRAVAIIAGFVTNPLPRGRKAAIVTVSGGAGALAADRLAAAGFDVPELGGSLQRKIADMLPAFASTSNPVDVTGQASRTAAPLNAIRALSSSDEVDVVIMAATMSRTIPPVPIEDLKAFVPTERKPLFFYTYTLPSTAALRTLAEAGMVTYTALDDITATADAMERYGRFLDREAAPQALPQARAPLPVRPGTASEHEAKDLLERWGIAIAPRWLLRECDDIVRVPASSYPVAAKIQSRDLPHKTEADGIRLRIGDAEALGRARDNILKAAASYKPGARIDGVLVEPMAPPGVEMIVGIVRDPVFGPIVTVGAGGTTAELIRDVARLQAPLTEAQAVDMLRSLKTFPLLDGYRGAPHADTAALAALVAQLSAFASAHADVVSEVELNPVLVHPAGKGVTIVDALIVADPSSVPVDQVGEAA
jgi:acyl-CoA synthetase (NDP forming)